MINFKKPIVFAVLYTVASIVFQSAIYYLVLSGIIIKHKIGYLKLGDIVYSFIALLILLVFSLLYSLYFKVKFNTQFKKLSSIYITAVSLIRYLVSELLSLILIKPIIVHDLYYHPSYWYKLTNEFSVLIVVMLMISTLVISAAVLFIVNYFLISWGNKLALWILKNKKVTEI